jgi:hypothetical protein
MPRTHRDDIAAAPMLRRFGDLRDYTIGATDGDIGGIADLYFDDVSWTVRYVVADTGTWLPGRKVLLSPASLRGFDAVGLRVRADLTRQQVKDSPSIDTDKPVSRQYETSLLTHYGHTPYWAGPYRWGPYAYPYPLLHAGVLPPVTESPYGNRVAEEVAARERESRDEHLRSARAVSGYAIRASDGDLGHVEDFLIDEHDWAIRYLIVDPQSWWPGPQVLIGTDWVRGVSWDDSVVEVDVTRESVRNAPRDDAQAAFDREAEARLYAHHGRTGYWDRRPERRSTYPPAA